MVSAQRKGKGSRKGTWNTGLREFRVLSMEQPRLMPETNFKIKAAAVVQRIQNPAPYLYGFQFFKFHKLLFQIFPVLWTVFI